MEELIIDLCCCAGAASRGYETAGFRVVGVDIEPQKNYPYPFIEHDAVELLESWADGENNYGIELDDIAAFHASWPCQGYSRMSNCRPGLAETYPRLIDLGRDLLNATGKPWIMENVIGAPLIDPVMLCGTMFGRELYRHRLFEANFPLRAPVVRPGSPASFLSDFNKECGWPHVMPASKAGHWRPGTVMSVAGHVSPMRKAREIMEIDWTTRKELVEAIPPYYAQYMGRQLRGELVRRGVIRVG